MKKEFVPYKQALGLKEMGFNEPCFGVYIAGQLMITTDSVYNSTDVLVIKAPTFSQAFKWFRERYGVFIYIHLYRTDMAGNPLEFEYYYRIPKKFKSATVRNFNTYEEAQEACLTKLIEIVQDENKQ